MVCWCLLSLFCSRNSTAASCCCFSYPSGMSSNWLNCRITPNKKHIWTIIFHPSIDLVLDLPSPLQCRRLLQRSGEEALGPGAPGYPRLQRESGKGASGKDIQMMQSESWHETHEASLILCISTTFYTLYFISFSIDLTNPLKYLVTLVAAETEFGRCWE